MKITKETLRQVIREEIENYYRLLEVPPDGRPTDDEKAIKKAYRKKALENHPDRGGDQEKMKSINVAGQTLLQPNKKQQYENKEQQQENKKQLSVLDKTPKPSLFQKPTRAEAVPKPNFAKNC